MLIPEIVEKYGSGWYCWQWTMGLSQVAYLDSHGKITVYDHAFDRARHPVDEYDFLRAWETGVVRKMTAGEIISKPYQIAKEIADADIRPEGYIKQKTFCTECDGPYGGWLLQYGGHWDTCPNRSR